MVDASAPAPVIYVEGGGDSKELRTRCREGFSKLLSAAGIHARPVAYGSRERAFDAFRTARTSDPGGRVYLLIDSEDPVADGERPWDHLKSREHWDVPKDVRDEEVFLMTTSMETWIVADRAALQAHYRADCLQVSALLPLQGIESADRHRVLSCLQHATRRCKNAYTKGARSFEVPATLEPTTIKEHLPAFARMLRILGGGV